VNIPSSLEVWRTAHAQPASATLSTRSLRLVAALLSALLLGGVGGYFVRPGSPAAELAAGPAFLLLLHEATDSQLQYSDTQLADIVGEYRDWANQLAADERLISAEKLRDDAGRWLAPSGALLQIERSEMVSGFFVIRARDYDEALELARRAPHLKYGGTIEVRAIERTSP
jgi:hypothetical protein